MNRLDRLRRTYYRALFRARRLEVQHGLLEELGFELRLGVSPGARWRGPESDAARDRVLRSGGARGWLVFLLLLAPVFAASPLVALAYVVICWWNRRMRRRLLEDFLGDFRAGVPLSEAVDQHPHLFDVESRSALRAGALASDVPAAVHAMYERLGGRLTFRRRFVSLLVYPAMVLWISFTVASVVVWKVFPTFAHLHALVDSDLPSMSLLSIELADWFRSGLVCLALIYFVGFSNFMSMGGTWLRDVVLIRLPFLGRSIVAGHRVLLCRLLALNVRSALPLDIALESVAAAFQTTRLARQLHSASAAVASGESLETALRRLRFLRPLQAFLLARAAEQDQFVSALDALADHEDGQARWASRAFLTYMETIAIVALAAAVALFVLGTYVTMNSIISLDVYRETVSELVGATTSRVVL